MTNPKTIGQLIEDEVRKQEKNITDFAKEIHCQRGNAYNLFKRCKIDILQLKLISKVLNRNFFKELAEDPDLINENEETEEDRLKDKALSQFFEVVPDILNEMGIQANIRFLKLDSHGPYENCQTPDFAIAPYFITFTIGNTMRERIGENPILPIHTITNNDGDEIEVATNLLYHSVDINMKINYKTRDEWRRILTFAFATYKKLHR